jgi:hypothetical protein
MALQCAGHPKRTGKIIDIGGANIITNDEKMMGYTWVRTMKRWQLPVPAVYRSFCILAGMRRWFYWNLLYLMNSLIFIRLICEIAEQASLETAGMKEPVR